MITTKLYATGALHRVKTQQQAVNFWASGETPWEDRFKLLWGLISTGYFPTNSQNESLGNELSTAQVNSILKTCRLDHLSAA